MAEYSLTPNPIQQFSDLNGDVLAGGLLYTYLSDLSTPRETYRSAGGVPNTNPVVLDSRGEALIYLEKSVRYGFVLKDSADVTIWTSDTIEPTGFAQIQLLADLADVSDYAKGDALIGYKRESTDTSIATSLHELFETGDISVFDFIPTNQHDFILNGDTASQDSAAVTTGIKNAGAHVAALGRNNGTLVFPGSKYLIDDTLTIPAGKRFKFRGDGRRSTFFVADTGVSWANGRAMLKLFDIIEATGSSFHMENISWNGNNDKYGGGGGAMMGIDVNKLTYATFTNVSVQFCNGTGLKLNGTWDCRFTGVDVRHCGNITTSSPGVHIPYNSAAGDRLTYSMLWVGGVIERNRYGGVLMESSNAIRFVGTKFHGRTLSDDTEARGYPAEDFLVRGEDVRTFIMDACLFTLAGKYAVHLKQGAESNVPYFAISDCTFGRTANYRVGTVMTPTVTVALNTKVAVLSAVTANLDNTPVKIMGATSKLAFEPPYPVINTNLYTYFKKPKARQAGKVYAFDDFMIPIVPNGYKYQCIVQGTASVSTDVALPPIPGNTFVDGTVTWVCRDDDYYQLQDAADVAVSGAAMYPVDAAWNIYIEDGKGIVNGNLFSWSEHSSLIAGGGDIRVVSTVAEITGINSHNNSIVKVDNSSSSVAQVEVANNYELYNDALYTTVQKVGVMGEVQPRMELKSDGKVRFGGGEYPTDVSISRTDLGELQAGELFKIQGYDERGDNNIWAATTAYALDVYAMPLTPNGYRWKYKCTVAGTSAGTEPVWPQNPRTVVLDGTVEWTCENKHGLLVIPYTDNTGAVRTFYLWADSTGRLRIRTSNTGLPNAVNDGDPVGTQT